MCNLYGSTKEASIHKYWRPNNSMPSEWDGGLVAPRKPGAFVRRARDDAAYSRELVVGRWGLIPWFSKTADIKYSTNNARSEELASKASFKTPWSRGQRCIIPADWFDEPNWESGKNVWWRFRRADGEPWGLAGLWNTWTDRASGEIHESYTMLTLHANSHSLMSRMHRPDLDPETKLPLLFEKQDKRSVIPVEQGDVDQWLAGTVQDAQELLRLAPVEMFEAGPSS
ncbi:SOS response-associated peptidase [Hydrogenophaga sp.]|uniref:SOS response-associated peptidase n=1 Tax=Hydrogenophaga sp. TaxID=1904254 RepID=UPI00272FA4FB|nr:SOS response-associated peptidase family protein [Hydrogenophaga sp.]MDP2018973.1 SOS response-associated peptidase family protein [Hydrogenophaga sp.]MDP3164351.1 SOS response-associated peptidase family protein [Hydrogenophaga sp.]